MSRKFGNTNKENSFVSWYYRAKWQTKAYRENNGAGPLAAKNLGFVERINYGFIDKNNYSVQPLEKHLVHLNSSDPLASPMVFDFVADAFSVMKLNYLVACKKNFIAKTGVFSDLTALQAYENPVLKYNEYLKGLLESFSLEYLPNKIGINNITSYETYVKAFFVFAKEKWQDVPLTFSRYQKSYLSSVLDTGLAIKIFNIGYDKDQEKINKIIDSPSFGYFKNICLNTGFSFLHNRPNIILFDMASPAARPFLLRKNLQNVDGIFRKRFRRTHMHDMKLLFNSINISYNNFVLLYPQTKIIKVTCQKLSSDYIYRDPIEINYIPNDISLIEYCILVRNIEESFPFSEQKTKNIFKKAKYLQKKFDTDRAMGYISNMFKDQVWNKDGGFDDLMKSMKGQTTGTSGNTIKGEQPSKPSGGGMGGSSGY